MKNTEMIDLCAKAAEQWATDAAISAEKLKRTDDASLLRTVAFVLPAAIRMQGLTALRKCGLGGEEKS